MLDPHTTLDYYHLFHRELIRQAEQARLANLVACGQQNKRHFYHAALAAFGRRLSAWGALLQHHYGHARLLSAAENIH